MSPTLTSRWNSISTKGKVTVSTSYKRTWEKLLPVARAIVTTETPADVSAISSRDTGQLLYLSCCCHCSHSQLLAASSLGPSLTRTKQSSENHIFWGWLTPVLPKATHRGILNTCLPSLCRTDSRLCYVDTVIPGNVGVHAGFWCGGYWPRNTSHLWEGMPKSTSTENLKRLRRAIRCWRDGDKVGISGHMDYTSSWAPCCSVTWLTCLRMCSAFFACSLMNIGVPSPAQPLKTGCTSHYSHWNGWYHRVVGHKLFWKHLNKMERRWAEKKQFLKVN